jgi:hypothetical protein
MRLMPGKTITAAGSRGHNTLMVPPPPVLSKANIRRLRSNRPAVTVTSVERDERGVHQLRRKRSVG